MRYIIANWKMNMSLSDITQWLEVFSAKIPRIPDGRIVVLAPSSPYLGVMREITGKSGMMGFDLKTEASSFSRPLKMKLAAQDVSLTEKGAHTGEVGAFQIQDFCAYSIVGHSERKESFDVSIEKGKMCVKNKITPISCFVQIEDLKKLLAVKEFSETALITWEDPANISIGGEYRAQPMEEISEKVGLIRQIMGTDRPLIYGGSVNRENVGGLAKIKGLNGVLVGNASNDPVHFSELVIKF